MSDTTAALLLSSPVNAAVAAQLAANPDGILERIASDNNVSTLEAVRALPSENVLVVSNAPFAKVMEAIATWGEVLFIVHTPNIVLECKGKVPQGTMGRGYFNIHGDSPIAGHIKADRCFVSRPFMGRASCSVQFFDTEGEAMFKIFVARDSEKELLPEQVANFEALRARYTANATDA